VLDTTAPANGDQPFNGTEYFGSDQGTGGFFNGAMDEIYISKAVLTAHASTLAANTTDCSSNCAYMNHLDTRSGTTATPTTGTAGALHGGAWLSTPLLAGTSNNISSVAVNVSGTAATAEVVSSTSTGAWSEISTLGATNNPASTPAALANSVTSLDGADIAIYQATSITAVDFAVCTASGTVRLQRR
jgi:hypothetical protein